MVHNQDSLLGWHFRLSVAQVAGYFLSRLHRSARMCSEASRVCLAWQETIPGSVTLDTNGCDLLLALFPVPHVSCLHRDTGQVVIHLGEVSNIDSSGLGLLASLCVSARKVSGDVKLIAPSAQVAESLKITKLGGVLDIYPTEQAALEALTTIPSARRAPGQPSRGKTPLGSVR